MVLTSPCLPFRGGGGIGELELIFGAFVLRYVQEICIHFSYHLLIAFLLAPNGG